MPINHASSSGIMQILGNHSTELVQSIRCVHARHCIRIGDLHENNSLTFSIQYVLGLQIGAFMATPTRFLMYFMVSAVMQVARGVPVLIVLCQVCYCVANRQIA